MIKVIKYWEDLYKLLKNERFSSSMQIQKRKKKKRKRKNIERVEENENNMEVFSVKNKKYNVN